ncbi:MAG: hypothetical protein M3380_20135 [Chloroflexota bacterium]|nr:hypothetical protein [Chloroflexota bacterium]
MSINSLTDESLCRRRAARVVPRDPRLESLGLESPEVLLSDIVDNSSSSPGPTSRRFSGGSNTWSCSQMQVVDLQ